MYLTQYNYYAYLKSKNMKILNDKKYEKTN